MSTRVILKGQELITIEKFNENIGELNTLSTEDKSNLVNAINEVINNNISSSAIIYDNDMNITQNSLTIGSNTRIKIKDVINKNLDNSVLICVHNSTFRINLYFMTYISKPTNSITSQVNVFGLLTNYSEVHSWTARMNVGKNGTTGLVTSVSFSNSVLKQYSTKEYVDDLVGDISTVLATLTTVSEVNE